MPADDRPHPTPIRFPPYELRWLDRYAGTHEGVTRNGLVVQAVRELRARLERAERSRQSAARTTKGTP